MESEDEEDCTESEENNSNEGNAEGEDDSGTTIQDSEANDENNLVDIYYSNKFY